MLFPPFVSHPARLTSDCYVGRFRHFLTACTYKRRLYFRDVALVGHVRTHFLRTAMQESIEILAYCFMPDHLHLLVTGATENADVRRFIRLAKQLSGYEFHQHRQTSLWQPSYFDRALRGEDDTEAVVAYIVANPVRAQLVERADDYPFWGSDKYTRQEILEFVQTHSSRWA